MKERIWKCEFWRKYENKECQFRENEIFKQANFDENQASKMWNKFERCDLIFDI